MWGTIKGFPAWPGKIVIPPDAPDFTLLNQNSESVTLSDYSDKVVVVAFIYTSCPDVCLAISANLAWIHQNLGEYSDDVVILSITIDPARDTVDRFAQWTEANGYEWDHLSAERPSTLVNVWNSWNIGNSRNAKESERSFN